MRSKLQVIGGGRMGQALVRGLGDWDVVVVEVSPDQRSQLTRDFPDIDVVAEPIDGVDTVVAVKPHLVVDVCRKLTPTRIMSVAAGVPIAAIEGVSGDVPVVRAMPNTPALVGAGVAAVAAGGSATTGDVDWALSVLSAVGRAVVVDESQLDAVTGLSGSGPAYVFLLAEAMIDAGVRVGLTRAVATELAVNTIAGAGRMMVETGESPVDLRAAVTTPAGTTASGLAALEDHGLRAAVSAAVVAATDRSVDIGRTQQGPTS